MVPPSRRTQRRRKGIPAVAVLGILSVLFVLFGSAPAAIAAPTAAAASSPCGSDPTPPNGKYYWTAVYLDGHKSYCGYYSEFQWMTDVRNADVRGFDRQSAYSSIYVRDGYSGAEVAAHFPTSCGAAKDPFGRCPVTISVVHEGPGDKSWNEGTASYCDGLYVLSPVAESVAWGAFLEDAATVEANDTALRRASISAAPRPHGNQVDISNCGNVGPV